MDFALLFKISYFKKDAGAQPVFCIGGGHAITKQTQCIYIQVYIKIIYIYIQTQLA